MVLNHIYSRQPAEGRRQYFNPAEVDDAATATAARATTAPLPGGEAVEVQYEGLGTMSKSREQRR